VWEGGDEGCTLLSALGKSETDLWDMPGLDHAHQGVVCADAGLKNDETGESREGVRAE